MEGWDRVWQIHGLYGLNCIKYSQSPGIPCIVCIYSWSTTDTYTVVTSLICINANVKAYLYSSHANSALKHIWIIERLQRECLQKNCCLMSHVWGCTMIALDAIAGIRKECSSLLKDPVNGIVASQECESLPLGHNDQKVKN